MHRRPHPAAALAVAMLVIPAIVRADDPPGAGAPIEPRKVDVFVKGEGGYHAYRIPSVIAAANGDLLAFAEGRKSSLSDAGDIDLVMRRSTDGGATWGKMHVLWDDGGNTCGNPCPVVDRKTGVIHLLLGWGRGDDHERQILEGKSKDTRRVYVMASSDHGETWSKPAQITESVKADDWAWYATGPGAGIQLERGKHAGRLVVPCDHSVLPWSGTDSYRSHAIYSDDGGKTWNRSEPIAPGVNECEVVELVDGRLMMNMRNYRRSEHRARAVSISEDGGATWSPVTHDPALIEPVCQASIRRLSWPNDDKPGSPKVLGLPGLSGVIAFSNPADEKSRRNLTIRLSYNDGATWPVSRTLHAGSAAYSCLVALPNDDIGCLYEADDYQRIVFARFPQTWVTARTDAPK